LPMAFVTGLMGPYMSPIPINASTGMLISLIIAFVVTPWLANRLIPVHHTAPAGEADQGGLYPLFKRYVGPMLQGKQGSKKRWQLFWGHTPAYHPVCQPGPAITGCDNENAAV